MSDTNDNTTTPPPAPGSAAAAYATHVRNVSAMLGWLEAELEAHAAKQKASPANWGPVGDLVALEPMVRAALAHLSAIGEASIDRALAELGEG